MNRKEYKRYSREFKLACESRPDLAVLFDVARK